MLTDMDLGWPEACFIGYTIKTEDGFETRDSTGRLVFYDRRYSLGELPTEADMIRDMEILT